MTPRIKAVLDCLEQKRASSPHPSQGLDIIIESAAEAGIELEADEVWSIAGRIGGEAMLGLAPPPIRAFARVLFGDRRGQRVLDPWAGAGSLLSAIDVADAHNTLVGWYPYQQVLSAGRRLHPSAHLHLGTFTDAVNDAALFDVVVAALPYGTQKKRFQVGGVAARGDLGAELLLRSAVRLAEGGLGMFVVGPRFLDADADGALAKLPALGMRVLAIIDVPHGTFRPLPMAPAFVVVLTRGAPAATVFVGRLSDDEQQTQVLVANFRNRKAGLRPELGIRVPLAGYRGLEALLLEREVATEGERTGGTRTTLGAIATITPLVDGPKGQVDVLNAFFLPLLPSGQICVRPEHLSNRASRYVHVAVNPDVAVASVVIGLLEGPLGQRVRKGMADPVKSRIPVGAIKNLPVWLPAIGEQQRLAAVSQKVQTLRRELDNLSDELWTTPEGAVDIEDRITTLNRTDSVEEWVDTLPFPLASVLWAYHGLKDPLRRYHRLDFFFEALVQYLAILMMSGVHRDNTRFEAEWPRVEAALVNAHLSLQRTTMGAWRAVYGKLAKTVRADIEKNADNIIFWKRMFAIDDDRLLDALVSKEMSHVVEAANNYRNTWRGHGGVVGDEEATRRERVLAKLLSDFRRLIGLRWTTAPLVTAVTGKFVRGTYRYQVRRVVGVRTPFETVEVEVFRPMEDGYLYVLSPATGEACELLPFVRMGPSPPTEPNACYFYNKLEGATSMWNSYHFEQKNELKIEVPELNDALSMLSRSNS